MTTDRLAAIALVAGSIAGLFVMALHPTSSETSVDIASGRTTLAEIVHWIAIVAQPLLVAGMLAVTVKLRAQTGPAVGAFVFFALAGVAVMLAAAASGLVAPGILRGMHDAGEPSAAATMGNFLHYNFLVNQALARMYVVLAAIAIALWSWAILGGGDLPRALAIYGLLLSAVLLAGLASGHLTLGIHGFGLVVLGQSIWLVWTAVALWRGAPPSAGAGG